MPELIQHEPLFLKYRPQTLGDLIGQESVKETITNAIKFNKLVHAYLLTGPRGAGKTSTARIIAKSLNCEQGPTVDPCGKCASCVSIANSSSIDVLEIDAASHGGVEDARSLIERVNLQASSGGFKIYIIDEVHMLSSAAFNALLKVFEEPPEKVVFILATTEEDKVLPTIVSRCQKFNFRSISVSDCIKRLRYVADAEKIAVDDEALAVIARRADGAMRDALGMLDQLSVFAVESSISADKVNDILGGVSKSDLDVLLAGILQKDVTAVLNQIDSLLDRGKESIAISRELAAAILDVLEGANDYTQVAAVDKTSYENFELVQMLEKLGELEVKMRQSTQAKNLFRAAVLNFVYRADIVSVKALEDRLCQLEQGGVKGGFAKSVPARLAPSLPTPPQHIRPAAKVEPTARTEAAASTESVIASMRGDQSPSLDGVAVPRSSVAPQQSPRPEEITSSPMAPRDDNVVSQSNDSDITVSRAMQSQSVSSDFMDHLPPSAKGLCISSKAQLVAIDNGTAKFEIPSRFKFLKDKIESKSPELLTALQASGQDVSNVVVEAVENSSVPNIPHLDPSYQTSMPNNELGKEEPEAKSVTVNDQALEKMEARLEDQKQDLQFSTGEICCERSAKLDDAVSMAKDIFSAKEI